MGPEELARFRRGANVAACAVSAVYGDSMILAECIFSQSATGEVSSAYFRKLAIPYLGVGSANFRKRAPTETRLEGEEEGDEEEEEEEEEEPEFDTVAAATILDIPYM